MGKKPVVQTINRSNKTTESRSAPGFFVLDPNVYATVKTDNRVEFFYTGEDYFSRLADAIDTAKTSIYIAGWQINYDVLLKSPPAPASTERSRWDEKERALQTAGVEDLLNDTYELALTKGYDGTTKFINDLATDTAKKGLKSSLRTASKKIRQKSLDTIPYLPTFEKLKEFTTKILNAVDIKGEFTRIVENANKGLENSLWQHLRKAVKRGVNVYVLPWSCPPVGPVNTGDLDTMLAVFQLNAGLQDEAGNPVKRAHFMFSTTRCDFPGLASLFFSHHQKTVIIDNQIGFVGGIDIAYGRRDNKQYSLDVSNRFGNDRYNPCIPHVNTALRSTHVSRSALFISTLFNISAEAQVANQLLTFADAASTLKNWLNTPLSWDVAYDIRLLFQLGNIVLETYKDSYKELLEYGIAIFGAFFGEYQVKVLDQLFLLYDNTRQHFYDWQNATRVTFEKEHPIINQIVQNIETIKYLADVKGIPGYPYTETIIALHKMDKPVPRELYILAIPEIRKWLVNTQPGQFAAAIMDITPTDDSTEQEATAFAQAKDLALSTIWHVFTLLQNRGLTKESPYYYLEEKFQALGPTGGVTLNGASQPRMPWHDMQVELEGPAVYDLARNFIDRWNCDQLMIQENSQPLMDNDLFVAILDWADRIVKGFDVSQWFIDSPDIKKALTDLGDDLLASTPSPDWIKTPELLPPKTPEEIKAANLTADNKAMVQIIRSAAKKYQKAEIKGRGKEGAAIANFITPARSQAAAAGDLVQQDCLKAWQKAIEDSQHYLYIETQFFQSAYDVDFGYKAEDANKNPIHSGPMQNHITYSFDLVQINAKEAIETLSLSKLNRDALRDIVRYTPQRVPQLLTDFNALWQQKLSQRITQEIFQGQDVKPTDAKEINTLLDSITKRIQKAIDNEQNYHVYLVMPVHPEGMLNSPATMHTIHLAMQTLFNGKQSFIKRIQKAICVHKIMKDKGYNKDQRPQAEQEAEKMVDNAPRYAKENWRQYLTLLNLRTWETFTNRGVTEQIYVHSKMLIADDNIAIVGTANVNDRSMLGGRDSEIAAIVRGTQGTKVKLDGKKDYTVSKLVHEFRVNIWRKLFALDIKHPSIKPANTLATHLNSPAAPETWQAIQTQAQRNANEYNKCFDFIPQNRSPYQAKEAAQEVKGPNPYPLVEQSYYPLGCSIWPQWVYSNPDDHTEGGKLYTDCVMPFDAKFWLGGTNYQFPNYAMPEAIEGFIVELPEQWTMGENNTSLYHHYIVS